MSNGFTEQKPLRIGTRGSDLALWQARRVRFLLSERDVPADLVIVKTRGDRIDDLPFDKMEGKGFFTKELEDALLEERVDLAVHSLKDLTTEMPGGLCLAALVGREDARELLVARSECVDEDRLASGEILPLRAGAVIGTSAARRQAQIRHLRSDLVIKDLRGNVPTRIKKLRRGDYEAILLAQAGVTRLELSLDDLWSRPLSLDHFVPAPGQGMLAIQCRDEAALIARLRELHDESAARAVEAERWLLAQLDGGCQLPFGVHLREGGGEFRLHLFWHLADRAPLRKDLSGPDPRVLAERALEEIRAVDAREAT